MRSPNMLVLSRLVRTSRTETVHRSVTCSVLIVKVCNTPAESLILFTCLFVCFGSCHFLSPWISQRQLAGEASESTSIPRSPCQGSFVSIVAANLARKLFVSVRALVRITNATRRPVRGQSCFQHTCSHCVLDHACSPSCKQLRFFSNILNLISCRRKPSAWSDFHRLVRSHASESTQNITRNAILR